MSLYNLIFGYNPCARVLLAFLKLRVDDVPRFRDCYLARAETGELEIAIYTRTGGGNRDEYENTETKPNNHDLRAVEGYVHDEDSANDSTYATFFYRVPSPVREWTERLVIEFGLQPPPAERWEKLFADLKEGTPSEEAKRAFEVGQTIIKRMEEIEAGDDERIIEV